MKELVPVQKIEQLILLICGQKEVIANCDNICDLNFYRGLQYTFSEYGVSKVPGSRGVAQRRGLPPARSEMSTAGDVSSQDPEAKQER